MLDEVEILLKGAFPTKLTLFPRPQEGNDVVPLLLSARDGGITAYTPTATSYSMVDNLFGGGHTEGLSVVNGCRSISFKVLMQSSNCVPVNDKVRDFVNKLYCGAYFISFNEIVFVDCVLADAPQVSFTNLANTSAEISFTFVSSQPVGFDKELIENPPLIQPFLSCIVVQTAESAQGINVITIKDTDSGLTLLKASFPVEPSKKYVLCNEFLFTPNYDETFTGFIDYTSVYGTVFFAARNLEIASTGPTVNTVRCVA